MKTADLDGLFEHLMRQGIKLGPGLSGTEVAQTERSFGFCFPTDLRMLLEHALPVSDGFPDWRSGDDRMLRERLAWPLEGLLFDIEHNAFWMESWSTRPSRVADAFDVARRAVAEAPTLIPVYSHRYLPAEPRLAGNPIFSVYQTDIIIYGTDLASYFHAEFGAPLPGWAAKMSRPIRFWNGLVG
jgi:hypothetical protein